MLLTKTVITKWNGISKKWYEDKGYKFTKMGDEFEVKVEDLTKGNGALVLVKCDNCEKELSPMMWKDYKKINMKMRLIIVKPVLQNYLAKKKY